jgi:hypothetical protein
VVSVRRHPTEIPDPALTQAGILWGAHRGYEFQDLVGACLLAVAVAEASGELAIELPRKPDLVFDDLEQTRDQPAAPRQWEARMRSALSEQTAVASSEP